MVLKIMGIDIHAKGENVTEEDIMYMVMKAMNKVSWRQARPR